MDIYVCCSPVWETACPVPAAQEHCWNSQRKAWCWWWRTWGRDAGPSAPPPRSAGPQEGSHSGGVSRGPRPRSPPRTGPESGPAGSVGAAAPQSGTAVWWPWSGWSQSVSGAPPEKHDDILWALMQLSSKIHSNQEYMTKSANNNFHISVTFYKCPHYLSSGDIFKVLGCLHA